MKTNHGQDPGTAHELWSLREDVDVEFGPASGPVRLSSPWGQITVPQPSPPVREALHRMRLGPVSLENISGVAVDENPAQRKQLFGVLDRLQPLIVRSVKLATGEPFLSVVPLTPQAAFHPTPLDPGVPIRLSAFAELRTDGREYRLESPLALHRIQLHRVEAVQLIGMLGAPCAPADAAAVLKESEIAATTALEYLIASGMVTQAKGPSDAGDSPDTSPEFPEDSELALAGWSPTDLMFHATSTLGRHDHYCGVTYPMDDAGVAWLGQPPVKAAAPQPAVQPAAPQPAVNLHRPRWDDLVSRDPPLTVAVEGRRSVRDHDGAPVTVTELGDLLYRTSRVRWLSDTRGARGMAPRVVAIRELSDRPYPGAGASYELELYLTVGRCSGLGRGVYHYDPLEHVLEPVSSAPAVVDELLRSAAAAAAMKSEPQVVLTLTARIQRVSWKYEGLPYRLVLMDAGVLIQNLYLACTAMGLAPCALGGVSSELVARAFGANWRTEPAISQFIVGRAASDDGHPGVWHSANDGDWADQARAQLNADRLPC